MRRHCCFRASGHTDIAIRFVDSEKRAIKESNRPNVNANVNVNVADLSTR